MEILWFVIAYLAVGFFGSALFVRFCGYRLSGDVVFFYTIGWPVVVVLSVLWFIWEKIADQ